jgi:hypothetical protein
MSIHKLSSSIFFPLHKLRKRQRSKFGKKQVRKKEFILSASLEERNSQNTVIKFFVQRKPSQKSVGLFGIFVPNAGSSFRGADHQTVGPQSELDSRRNRTCPFHSVNLSEESFKQGKV